MCRPFHAPYSSDDTRRQNIHAAHWPIFIVPCEKWTIFKPSCLIIVNFILSTLLWASSRAMGNISTTKPYGNKLSIKGGGKWKMRYVSFNIEFNQHGVVCLRGCDVSFCGWINFKVIVLVFWFWVIENRELLRLKWTLRAFKFNVSKSSFFKIQI